jgi:hypothetical protein
MKTRTRHVWITTLFIIALFFAVGESTHKQTGPIDDNQGGLLIALICLVFLFCVYAANGTRWLKGKLRRIWRECRAKRPSGSSQG